MKTYLVGLMVSGLIVFFGCTEYPSGKLTLDGVDTSGDDDDMTEQEPMDLDKDGYWSDVDCDDQNPDIYPGAEEFCDGLDNDCDDVVPMDEADNDLDGFRICDDDCNDADSHTYPDAPELCDGLDNDCNGIVPYEEKDPDEDGFLDCEDCWPLDEDGYPGAEELCDGWDNDCDEEVDEDGVCD